MEKIIAFKCSTCKQIYLTENECLEHETKCIENIYLNRCLNCINGSKTCYTSLIFSCKDNKFPKGTKTKLSKYHKSKVFYEVFNCQNFITNNGINKGTDF